MIRQTSINRVMALLLSLACMPVLAQTPPNTALRMQLQGGAMVYVPAPGRPVEGLDQPVSLRLARNGIAGAPATLSPPFTVTTTLPEGLLLHEYTPDPGQESHWTCATSGNQLTCIYSNALSGNAAGRVGLQFRVGAGFMPPANGEVPLLFGASSPDVPLNPDAFPCTSGNSTTTCAYNFVRVGNPAWVLNSFTHSASPTANTQNNAPMQPGGNGVIRLLYDCSSMPGVACSATPGWASADVYVQLPVGLYWRANPLFPLPAGVACTKLSSAPEGELVRCSQILAPNMVVPLYVDVSPDITAPSTVMVHATLEDPHQPAPESCVATPAHPNCASHPIDIIAPAAGTPLLVYEGNPRVWAVPTILSPGKSTVLSMRFSNRGTGAAAQSTLQLRLPPGLEYLNVTGGSAMSCTASGSVASGQSLICLRPVAIPAHSPSYTESLTVRFSGHVEVPVQVPVLFEISPQATGNAQRLDVCAVSPSLGQCALLTLDLVGNCANHGIDGIYCDGFENF